MRMKRRGSILAETVLVMPLLLLLIFGIFQFALIWTAKQMTAYAAFCAARAVLVERMPTSYDGTNGAAFTDALVAAQSAAEFALAPVSFADDGGGNEVVVPGWGRIYGSGKSLGFGNRVRLAMIFRDGGSETVTSLVQFRFPLLVPGMAINRIIENAAKSSPKLDGAGFYEDLDKAAGAVRVSWPYLTFTETCVLPLPYQTEFFPTGGYSGIDIRKGDS